MLSERQTCNKKCLSIMTAAMTVMAILILLMITLFKMAKMKLTSDAAGADGEYSDRGSANGDAAGHDSVCFWRR